MKNNIRFGAFIAPFRSRFESPSLAMRRDLDLIEHLDRLGFDEAWIGEHHSGSMEFVAAPELMIAAAAERTRRIRLGTGVKSLPYHNPFIVADTMVQLDHMTQGRAMFGVGPGALSSDAAMLGLDPRQARVQMEESIDVIMRLFAGERVTAHTDRYRLDRAKLQLEPFTRPHMEMAVTSVKSPSGAITAGKYGFGVLSLGGTSKNALEAYRRQWGILEETAALHGKSADRSIYRIAIIMHLAESREQALANVRFGMDEWGNYMQKVLPVGPLPPDVTDYLGYVTDKQIAVIGTVEDAIEHIEYVQEGSGGFGVVMIQQSAWVRPQAERESYDLFARYVMPHFQGQIAARKESLEESNQIRDRLQSQVEKGFDDADRRLAAQRGAKPPPAGTKR